jgi:acyl carrier protein
LQQSDIETEFAGILEKTAGVHRANLGPDTRLQSDLGLDSLAMIDVAVAAEDAFGVSIPDDDLERFQTVGDVVNYVQQAKS